MIATIGINKKAIQEKAQNPQKIPNEKKITVAIKGIQATNLVSLGAYFNIA